MNDLLFHRKIFKSFQGETFEVTLCEVVGARPGPVMTIIAGQHGSEHIGPVLFTRFIEEARHMDFRGVLRICPCANPLALEIDYEIYPENEDLKKLDDYHYARSRHYYCVFGCGRENKEKNAYYNMNRAWNQNRGYGVVDHITAWLWDDACRGADFVLDAHCAQREKPYISCPMPFPKALALAKLFGGEAIFTADYSNVADSMKGVLAYQANVSGIPSFSVEFSAQHALKPEDCRWGHRGVMNLMKALDMLDGEIIIDKAPRMIRSKSEIKLSSNYRGHIHYHFSEYDPVNKGEPVFEIVDIRSLKVLDKVVSPVDGIMGGRTYRPVNMPGTFVCGILQCQV